MHKGGIDFALAIGVFTHFHKNVALGLSFCYSLHICGRVVSSCASQRLPCRFSPVVLHEQFGKGVVVKLSTRKCTALFQDKERLMASAN